jgi:hypothetical protein
MIDKVTWAKEVPIGCYVPIDAERGPADRVVDRVLRGRVRNDWIDQYNRSRLVRSRVIKVQNGTNLLPRVAVTHPRVGIIYLVRHPLATAVSIHDLGWVDRLDAFVAADSLMSGPLEPWRDLVEKTAAEEQDQIVRLVLQWCLENVVPLRLSSPGDVHLVFYENLVLSTQSELGRIARYLSGRAERHWAGWTPNTPALAAPSPTAWRDNRKPTLSPMDRIADWQDLVDDATRTRALDLLARFGVDHLYGHSPLPQVDADRVLGLGVPPV